MRDDELRDRLHAMPEPTARIDVDAVVADARRRRRPKVVGVAVASVAGCLALLSPVVLPSILGSGASTATMQEAGVAEQGAPDAPAAPGSDAATAEEPGILGEPAPSGPPVAACAAVPISSVAAGLLVVVRDDDGDGVGTVDVQNVGDAPVDVAIGEAGLGQRAGDVLVVAPDVDAASVAQVAPTTLQPLASASFDATVLPATSSCGATAGTAEGDEAVAVAVGVVALAVDGIVVAQPVVVD
ncbi:hypothetical protein GCM10009846_20140 [Agrococcus versicolor]|uniref:SAF domain-containing protein n=1 Tax=Agrococcus versicolor TaxID=501482 RepID=A0ABP5MLE3_9MICO